MTSDLLTLAFGLFGSVSLLLPLLEERMAPRHAVARRR
jgi:hypothetical protein